MTTVKAWTERLAQQWDMVSEREQRTIRLHHLPEDQLLERLISPPKGECAYNDALVLWLPRTIETIPTLPSQLEEMGVFGPVRDVSKLATATTLTHFSGHRIKSNCLEVLPDQVKHITLTCIDDPDFSWQQLARFTRLESLAVRHSGCPAEVFRTLSPTLTSLDMRGVQLTEWSALSHLVNLQMIDVSFTPFMEECRHYLPPSIEVRNRGAVLTQSSVRAVERKTNMGQNL